MSNDKALNTTMKALSLVTFLWQIPCVTGLMLFCFSLFNPEKIPEKYSTFQNLAIHLSHCQNAGGGKYHSAKGVNLSEYK